MHWKYWRDTWGKAISLYDAPTPIEQLLLTKSKTDYLYYRYVFLIPYISITPLTYTH